jgi:hypothetical protein
MSKWRFSPTHRNNICVGLIKKNISNISYSHSENLSYSLFDRHRSTKLKNLAVLNLKKNHFLIFSLNNFFVEKIIKINKVLEFFFPFLNLEIIFDVLAKFGLQIEFYHRILIEWTVVVPGEVKFFNFFEEEKKKFFGDCIPDNRRCILWKNSNNNIIKIK